MFQTGHRTGTNLNSWFSNTHKVHRYTGEKRSGKPRLQLYLWEWISESSEDGHPSGWTPFFVTQVLRTNAISNLTSWSEMPWSFSYTWKEAVKSWVEQGLFFSLLWCICSMNLSLHVSVLPQLPLDTCYICAAQICALQAMPWSHQHHLLFHSPLRYPLPSPASNSILTAAGSRNWVLTQDVNSLVHIQMYHKVIQEYISS